MNKLNIQQTGGFPLTTNTLDFLQSSLLLMQEFGNIAGDLAIIRGCEVRGTQVSDGVVYINGEILPFVSGNVNRSVIITERETKKQFEDGSTKPVEITREARFGRGVKSYPWSDFTRIEPLKVLQAKVEEISRKNITKIWQRIGAIEQKLALTIPIGLIAIWDRTASEIPEGWVEHTELKGKVPAGKGEGIFSNLGASLGQEEYKLTSGNIPRIKPQWKASKGVRTDLNAGRDALVYSDGGSHKHNQNIDRFPIEDIGNYNPTPIPLIQPTRIVRYIRFVGFNND